MIISRNEIHVFVKNGIKIISLENILVTQLIFKNRKIHSAK